MFARHFRTCVPEARVSGGFGCSPNGSSSQVFHVLPNSAQTSMAGHGLGIARPSFGRSVVSDSDSTGEGRAVHRGK